MTQTVVPKKNELIEISIEDMGADGEGIGKYHGFTFFIKHAVIGDVIQALVLKIKKTYGYAKIVKILESSPFRVTPLCPLEGKCGGCQLQHLAYEKQLEYKQNKVKNALERIGGIRIVSQRCRGSKDVCMEPMIGMEDPFYYRNKAQFPVGRNKDGKVVIGFYAGHTHSIIDTTHCFIQANINECILKKVRDFLVNENISIYEEESHKGLVRHILTRVGFTTGEVMVCLVVNGSVLPKQDILVKSLKEIDSEQDFFRLKSVCLNQNTERTNVILGDMIVPIWGETFITDYIGDVKYQISPLSFYQVNPVQTKKLYEKVLEYAQLTGEETVWDLYCGIGTISLFLARYAKQVFGVEIIPQAIEDAKRNAEINHIGNAKFFVGAAEEVLPRKYAEEGVRIKADVVVVDPPRKGCDEVLLNTIVKMEPEKIVYVSCDPATLARDLKFLTGARYEVMRVVAVDQFGNSFHVEVVTCLRRVNS